jgi:outer membrane protein assembly factor BamD (BamD/ComL family)
MKNNKVRIIIISIVVVVVVAVGTVTILMALNNTKKQETVVVTKSSADKIKTQAIDALKANDKTKAKQLFEQAKSEYTTLNDTNNVTDMDAQLYLIEHSK